MTLAPGQPAPAFVLPSAQGDVAFPPEGRAAVLYFYPRDDTPGCTTEALAFSALMPEFEALGVAVYGVSKDPVAKHERFAAKHALTVPLLSDERGDACERYGVWVEKSMYGRASMGVERATFLVDASGTLREAWRKVKVPGHAEAVLAAARGL